MSNGSLLTAAEQSGFEVLITVDRNLPYQQRLGDRETRLIILEGRTTNLDDLLALIPDVLTLLEALKPGDVVRVKPTVDANADGLRCEAASSMHLTLGGCG